MVMNDPCPASEPLVRTTVQAGATSWR